MFPFNIFSKKNKSVSQIGWFCNMCWKHITENDGHYHCFECTEFDICLECFDKRLHSCNLLRYEKYHRITISNMLESHSNKSLADYYHSLLLLYHNRPFLGTAKYNDKDIIFNWISYGDLHYQLVQYYFGIHDIICKQENNNSLFGLLGISYNHKIASLDGIFMGICSRNCLEWVLADFGSVLCGMVTAPIHVTFSLQQKKVVLVNSKIKYIIIGTRNHNNRKCGCKDCSPYVQGEGYELLEEFLQLSIEDDVLLEHLFVIETPCNNVIKRAKEIGIHIHILRDILEIGENICKERKISKETLDLQHNSKAWNIINSIPPCFGKTSNNIFTIMYTSGSTGDPKGVVISKDFWLNFLNSGSYYHDPLVSFSFCPLAHGMDRRSIGATFSSGGRVGLFENSMDTILEHVQAVNPSVFAAIPRFWNQIHANFKLELKEATLRIVDEHEIAKIRNKLLEKFGSTLGFRIKEIITGGAPTADDVFTFLKECFCTANISNGYGATEVGGITHNQRIVPNIGTEIKLEDVPDMGYYVIDKPYPRGEICVKKKNMMSEYYNNPTATAAAFTEDGFFRTGDIGERIGENKYNIIARKKHIFKLAQGEFVAPESLENIYQSSTCVDQIFVYGNTLKDFLLAVVVPKKEYIISWWQSINDNKLSFEEICIQDITKDHILRQLHITGLSKSLVSYEYIRGIIIEQEPFSLENKLLTGPFKINRRGCESKYYKHLENLYKEIENTKSDEILQNNLAKIIEGTISKLANDVLGSNIISMNSNLLQFGLDSLSALKLSRKIEESLGTQVKIAQLLSANTKLEDISKAISSKSDINDNIDWNKECLLPETIKPLIVKPNSIDIKNCNILVTGATGFLGATVFENILHNYPNSKITCLVRKTPEQMQKILKNAWSEEIYNKLWDSNKITLISCDLSKDKLGLQANEIELLENSIDIIIHIAAYVHSVLPYSALKKVNVDSTLELLKLCCIGKPKIFHYVSTAGVLHGISYPEQPLDQNHPFIEKIGGYSQSKWVAERLVSQAKERGLCCTISRPSRISPHSITGYYNTSDFMILVLQGLIKMKVYPISNHVHWNLASVDFVSKAIIEIIQFSSNISTSEYHYTYNINNPHNTISMKKLIKWIKNYGYDIYQESYETWSNRLNYIDENNPILPLREFFQGLSQFPYSPSPSCKELYKLIKVQPTGMNEDLFIKMMDLIKKNNNL